MFILFAPGKMLDRVLQAEIGGKLAQGALEAEEFPETFQLFAQTLAGSPFLLREAALRFGRPNWCCQINVGKEAYGIWSAQDGLYACCGAPHAPALVVTTTPEDALSLLAGGEWRRGVHFDYTGPRQEALALQYLFERFLDEFLPFRAKPAPPESRLTIGVLGVEDAQYFHQRDELVSTEFFDTLEALLESRADAALVSPAQTPDAWLGISRACERHGRKLMAADLPRFLPAHNYVRKILRAGLIGEVRTVRVLANSTPSFAALEFILGCECVDITAVNAEAAIARFANNALVHITMDVFAENAMEIYGTAGVIHENHAWAKPVRFFSSDPRMAEDLETWVEPYVEHTAPDWETFAARKALAAFAGSILENRPPDLTPAQTARGIACLAAMELSAAEGRAVTPDEMDPESQIAGRIQPLPQALWEGYELPFRYETAHYYDTELVDCEDGLGVAFTKKAYEAPVVKAFSDKLYQPCWDGAEACGILEDDALIACVEVWRDGFSNRLRVTQMWVAEEYRGQGYGRALMEFAKARAAALGCRALILETQSCNEGAIAFYQKQGLTLFGFDRCCYSNRDIENREVRLEMGLYF